MTTSRTPTQACASNATTKTEAMTLIAGAKHPVVPSQVRTGWIDNEMGKQEYDEEEHVDCAHALHQPGTQT